MSLCINLRCPNAQNRDTQLFCQSCGSELLLDGRYRVTCKLGSGGFGQTYEVSDDNGITQVLKVLINNDPKNVELFQREAQVLSQLKHQGIPKVEPNAYFLFWPSNSQEPLHCLVMEKIEGLNLHQYIQKRGNPIDQKSAIRWLTQLVTVLQEVHNQNFFHRDIKPSNIMLKVDGQLVLIDFGTVREITESFVAKQSSGHVTRVISTGYTPPEQFNGQAVPQSDFFALGRTFVFLLTGKDPSKFYDLHTEELRWRDAVPGISPQFADLLDRLMARSPTQRPQSAEVILQQLVEINRTVYSLPVVSQFAPLTQPTWAKPTSYLPQPVSPTAPLNNITEQSVASTPPQTASRLDPDFISRCQQELAVVIGPIAGTLCQRTLKENPGLSETEFLEAVVKKIPDAHQKKARDIQHRLLS